MSKKLIGTLVKNEIVATDVHEMTFHYKSASVVMPGQFLNIAVPGNANGHILKRPISIYDYDEKKDEFKLIVQRKGEGTQLICDSKVGTEFDIVGPLGRGYSLPEGAKRAAVVGGGIGVAPLLYCMKKWPDIKWDAYVGFRSGEYIYGIDDFKSAADSVMVTTDDGSFGTKGFVTSVLDNALSVDDYDIVMACGPGPMFGALQQVMAKHPDVHCLVSLEERMACGIGACMVCSCKIKDGDGWRYDRVCADGPVFDIKNIL